MCASIAAAAAAASPARIAALLVLGADEAALLTGHAQLAHGPEQRTPHGVEHALQGEVAGEAGDERMELEVQPRVLLGVAERVAHPGEQLLELRAPGGIRREAGRGEGGGAHLERRTEVHEDEEAVPGGVADRAGEVEAHDRAVRRTDPGGAAVADLDDAEGGQGGERLAHHGLGDGEALGEGGGGGEGVPGAEVLGVDEREHRVPCPVHEGLAGQGGGAVGGGRRREVAAGGVAEREARALDGGIRRH